MVELWLFVIVGAVAVVAAGMMLQSVNVVHGALFLILNFACVAFMYLMLDAPFLAMVQIAVYAGAIMVLFLFVIMLLGAENAESDLDEMKSLPGYRFHTPIAMILALVLLVTVGIGIGNGDISTLENTGSPMLRVVHYYDAANEIMVEVDGVLAEELIFRDATNIVNLEPGEHHLKISALGDSEVEEVLYESTFELEAPEFANTVTTVVAHGTDELVLSFVNEDMSAPPDRKSRLVVLNGVDVPISLQDTGIFGRDGDGYVFISALEPGAVSEAIYLDEGTYDSLRFVRPEDETDDSRNINPLFTILERDLDRDETTLVVLRSVRNSNVPEAGFFSTTTLSQFGSPKAVGQLLFTRYLLPFEVVSLLLLAALVGVIIIAQRQVAPVSEKRSAARRPIRRRVSRPLTSVIANQVTTDASDAPQLGGGDPAVGD